MEFLSLLLALHFAGYFFCGIIFIAITSEEGLKMSILTAGEYCIKTFISTHMALAAEKAASESQIEFLLVPLPIGISASCGLGLKYLYQFHEELSKLLADKNITEQGNYYCIRENGKLVVTEIK